MNQFVVSARKYRPGLFNSVVGQDHITGTLKNAIKNNHLAQSFLFCGPRGVGKTTCARILAKTINCENITAETEACNQCESCINFDNNQSLNIYELDAASNNSVDDIRNLVDQVRYAPHNGKYKIYIIDEVHMLSASAFNAFLKTLEEPPSYVVFILATTEKHKIIPTILSRCQIFDFNRIKISDIADHLAFIAKSEGVNAEPEALHVIAQKAEGALRDALSMFDQIVSYSGNNLSYKDVITNLNVLDYDYYFRITNFINENNYKEVLLIFDELLREGFDGHNFINGLSGHFRDLLMCSDVVTLQLLEVPPTVAEEYKKQAAAIDPELLLAAIDICNRCDLEYKASKNQRLHVELALMKMCRLKKKPDYELIWPSVDEKELFELELNNLIKETTSIPAKPEKKSISAKTGFTVSSENKPEPTGTVKTEPVKKPPTETLIAAEPVARPQTGSYRQVSPALNVFSEFSNLLAGNNNQTKPVERNRQPYNTDQLNACLEQFAQKCKSESQLNLAYTLKTHKAIVKADDVILFTLDSNLQALQLEEVKSELLTWLKQGLENDYISIEIEVDVVTAKKAAYTPLEKFLQMSNSHPNIDKLKSALDLDFGY